MDIENLKIPPHSTEAEQSVIGAILLDNKSFERIESLCEDDFYHREHRVIFSVMSSMISKQKPADELTLIEQIRRENILEDAGGESYIFELVKNTPGVSNVSSYARIVKEKSTMRNLICAAGEIADMAFHPKQSTIEEIVDESEKKILSIQKNNASSPSIKTMSNLLQQTMDRIGELELRGSSITGMPSGFDLIDEQTLGFQNQDLIILAARPSMGKTAFAMNIAQNAAEFSGKTVLVFSMEMDGMSLCQRMLASSSGVELKNIRSAKLTKDEMNKICVSLDHLNELKIVIDESSSLTPLELRSRARNVLSKHKDLGLIIVDYLQLMNVPSKSENKVQEVSEISRSLKSLAKEFNIPVIALSQLNRALENRQDKRPIMSDLRDSGSIEQDSDLIMFVYRDEVYNPESFDKNIAEIIIRKNRNGAVGDVKLRVDLSRMKFW